MSAVVVLTAYFSVFNSGVSNNANNWSSFGSYVSGLMMPILTVINIYVFIRLTTVLDEKNTKRQQNDTIQQEERKKEEIEHQQKLHNEELEFQKRKIITEIRQDSINKLSTALDDVGMQNHTLDRMTYCTKCDIELDTFLNQKSVIFSIEENEEVYKSLLALKKSVANLREIFKEEVVIMVADPSQFKEDGLGQTHTDKTTEQLRVIWANKHKALTDLQKYTIDNI